MLALGGLHTWMDQNFLQTLYSRLPLKVKTFVRMEKTEQTSFGKRWCQCQEGNNHPESNCEPTTLNQPDSSCHLQVQHSFGFPNTPPPLFPPSAVWLLWLAPILYSQCFSLSAVSLIYILSSDQRTRWNAPLLSPPFPLLYPCSPHQHSPLPLLLLLPRSCLILSLTSSWTSFHGS